MTGEPFLQPGDSGDWVTYLQRALVLVGIDPAPEVTGSYDDATAASVRAVRSTAGLTEGDTTDDEVWAAVLTPGVVAELGADSTGAAGAERVSDPADVTLMFVCPVEVEDRDLYAFDIQAGAWADVPSGTFEMKEWIMYADGSYEENGTMPLQHDIPAGEKHRIRQIIDPKRDVAEGEQITMYWDFQGKTNERLAALFTRGARRTWTVNDSTIDYL
jgi:peptidoglycan hydrolase-like protein with peptidoglycan-binding domain